MKKFEGSEVTAGNATGKAGVPSMPFGRGYYQSGSNNGAAGINFTSSADPSFKTYKSMKHSKKNVKKRIKKMKKFQEFNEDATATMGNSGGMGGVVAATPSSTPGDVSGGTPGSGDIGQTLSIYTKPALNLRKEKKKKREKLVSYNNFKP